MPRDLSGNATTTTTKYTDSETSARIGNPTDNAISVSGIEANDFDSVDIGRKTKRFKTLHVETVETRSLSVDKPGYNTSEEVLIDEQFTSTQFVSPLVAGSGFLWNVFDLRALSPARIVTAFEFASVEFSLKIVGSNDIKRENWTTLFDEPLYRADSETIDGVSWVYTNRQQLPDNVLYYRYIGIIVPSASDMVQYVQLFSDKLANIPTIRPSDDLGADVGTSTNRFHKGFFEDVVVSGLSVRETCDNVEHVTRTESATVLDGKDLFDGDISMRGAGEVYIEPLEFLVMAADTVDISGGDAMLVAARTISIKAPIIGVDGLLKPSATATLGTSTNRFQKGFFEDAVVDGLSVRDTFAGVKDELRVMDDVIVRFPLVPLQDDSRIIANSVQASARDSRAAYRMFDNVYGPDAKQSSGYEIGWVTGNVDTKTVLMVGGVNRYGYYNVLDLAPDTTTAVMKYFQMYSDRIYNPTKYCIIGSNDNLDQVSMADSRWAVLYSADTMVREAEYEPNGSYTPRISMEDNTTHYRYVGIFVERSTNNALAAVQELLLWGATGVQTKGPVDLKRRVEQLVSERTGTTTLGRDTKRWKSAHLDNLFVDGIDIKQAILDLQNR